MKEYQGTKITGIDNGYGNIKTANCCFPAGLTANCCFPAGLTAHDTEPVFKDKLLVYGGRYYLIGTGHKEFTADKTGDDVFPQGFAAVASQIRDFQGVNMLCDIGNGTMNIMFINDRRPAADRMFTEKYGTHQCMLAVTFCPQMTMTAKVPSPAEKRRCFFHAGQTAAEQTPSQACPPYFPSGVGVA